MHMSTCSRIYNILYVYMNVEGFIYSLIELVGSGFRVPDLTYGLGKRA